MIVFIKTPPTHSMESIKKLEQEVDEVVRRLNHVETNAEKRNEILIRIEERVRQMQETLSLMQSNYVNTKEFDELKRNVVYKPDIVFMQKTYYFVLSSLIASVIGGVLYAAFKI